MFWLTAYSVLHFTSSNPSPSSGRLLRRITSRRSSGTPSSSWHYTSACTPCIFSSASLRRCPYRSPPPSLESPPSRRGPSPVLLPLLYQLVRVHVVVGREGSKLILSCPHPPAFPLPHPFSPSTPRRTFGIRSLLPYLVLLRLLLSECSLLALLLCGARLFLRFLLSCGHASFKVTDTNLLGLGLEQSEL